MVAALKLSPLLTGLEEAELYHRPEDHGFFTVLWDDPALARRINAVRAERRRLERELERAPGRAAHAV